MQKLPFLQLVDGHVESETFEIRTGVYGLKEKPGGLQVSSQFHRFGTEPNRFELFHQYECQEQDEQIVDFELKEYHIDKRHNPGKMKPHCLVFFFKFYTPPVSYSFFSLLANSLNPSEDLLHRI